VSLHRYLALSFVVTTALFYALYFPARANIIAEYGPVFSTTPLLIMIPILTAFFTYHAVLPLAHKVPTDERTNFWSYKEANRPIWMMLAIVSFGYVGWGLGLFP
jgi:drug/metabolite transporter (DMT)-like permease